MARPTATVSKSRTTSIPDPGESTPVFNHMNHSIGFGVRRRAAGTPGEGADAYTIEFAPGNNSKTSEELENCKTSEGWAIYTSKTEHRSLLGKVNKLVALEVGFHDPEFEVDAKDLGDRMHQLRQLRNAQAG